MNPRYRRLVTLFAFSIAPGAMGAGALQAEYLVVPPTGGGVIAGHVTFDGPVPSIPSISVKKNPEICGATVPDPNATAVDPKTHGVASVLLSLANVSQGKAPAEVYTLANQGCSFQPHVLAAMAGKTFALENMDATIHNTHIRFNGRTLLNDALSFHEGDAMYHPVKDDRLLQRPGMLKVNCDIHEWMGGYVDVLENPYFAVTDKDGSYKIADVPPGTYTVKVWHENLGEKTENVTVSAGKTATLDVVFKNP